MNEGPNALFVDEYGRPYGAADVPRPRVNALFAPWAPTTAVPSGQASLDALLRASPGWRSGQSGQAYLDSVLSRPAAAPRPADQLARLGLDADVPAVPEPVHDAPAMPEAGRAYRDAALAALPDKPGDGHRWTFLPLSHDVDGTMHVAVPGVARDLAVGGADLLDAFANATGRTDFWGNPLPATVTPQATLALMALGGLGAPAGVLAAGGSRTGAAGIEAAGNVAESGGIGYNPFIARTPEAAQRPFAADYPGMVGNADAPILGSPVAGGGAGSIGSRDLGGVPARLATDIEGRPLTAPTVVGRQSVGGPDVAFSAPDLETARRDIEALSQALTGAPTRILPGGGPVGQENMGDSLGRLWPTGRTMPAEAGQGAAGRPVYQVDVADSVPKELRPAVVAHEGAGHGIDVQARLLQKMDLGPDAVRQQLFRVYDALARLDPLRAEKAATVPPHLPAGPETFGYAPHQVGKELIVEALRGYLANPNWFKSVAPDVAAQMRGIVNTDPFVSRFIQLNSAGDPIAAAGLAAAGQAASRTPAAPAAADQRAPLLVDTGAGIEPSPIQLTAPAAPPPEPPVPQYDRYGRMAI